MNPLRRLLDALKNLGHKKKHLIQYGNSEPAETDEQAFQNFAKDTWEVPRAREDRPKPRRTAFVPRAGYQATRKDLSKFFDKGKTSKMYRKMIKRKVQPEED